MDDSLTGWETWRYLYGRSSFEEDKTDFRETHPSFGWKPKRLNQSTHTMHYRPASPDPPYQIALPAEPGDDWIYFIHAPEVRRVKIGFSTDPESRLASLQVGSPVELRLIKLIRGNRNEEARLHFRFRDKRLDGEWFDESVLDDWTRGE